jgi:transcriptional regulator
MYTSAHFENTSVSALRSLISRHPLATLVTPGPDGMNAEHVPILFVEGSSRPMLHGHVAKANPVWQAASDGSEVLAIFQGPNRYISPRWYPSKHEHGRVVPTWNYVVVHARGKIRWIHDAGWLRRHVEAVSVTHKGLDNPWRVSDAPAEFIDRLLGAIVGFEIDVAELKGKWKLSQNRSAADRRGVIEALRRRGDSVSDEMADWMASEKGTD